MFAADVSRAMVNIMRMRLRNLSLCVAALLFLGGQGAAVGRAASDGGAGQTVHMRVGQEVTVDARRLRIRFIAVSEDSRCPEGVQCIWAGNARVRLKLGGAKNRAVTVELGTMTGAREITYANYTVKLSNLAPRPVRDRQPTPREYVATLVVTKKS